MNEQRLEQLEQKVASLTQQVRELREIVQSDYAPGYPDRDPLYHDAINAIHEEGMASPALLQRVLKIGYPRAAALMDLLESNGLIEPADGAKPRKLIISNLEY